MALPAWCSLGGDLLKLAMSVRQSHVEFLGAGHDGFPAQLKQTRLESEEKGDGG